MRHRLCAQTRRVLALGLLALAVLAAALPPTTAYADTLSDAGSAYAVLTDDGELIFFRSEDVYENDTVGTFTDIGGTSYTGRVFADFETTSTTGTSNSRWYAYRKSVTTVRIAEGQTIRPTNTNNWFNGCSKLADCDLLRLDTSRDTDMKYMFAYCTLGDTFKPLISTWDTSQVTDMSYMFYNNSYSNFNPDVSGWNTSKVTNMSYMFYQCAGRFFRPDVSGWDTSHVTDMSFMFWGCSGMLFNPDVSGWDVSSVTSMYLMFYACWGMSFNPDFSHWDTSNVRSMYGMFERCRHERFRPDLSGWNTSNVTNMARMFSGCTSLAALDLSAWNTSNVVYMQQMFDKCEALRQVTLGADFSFKGAGIEDVSWQALLPTPATSTSSDGRWINITAPGATGLTAEALRDGYDGSLTMGSYARGTYVWQEVHEYELTFDLGGGEASATYPSTYIAGAELSLPGTDGSSLPAPTRYGQDFAGWVDEAGTPVTVIEATSETDRTITATWVAANLSLSVPTVIGCVVCADGTIIGPEDTYLENESSWPVYVSEVLVTAHDGWQIVGDVAEATGANRASIRFGPVSDPLSAFDCLAWQEVSDPDAWTMGPAGTNDRLPIALTGQVAQLTLGTSDPLPLATLQWRIRLAPES